MVTRLSDLVIICMQRGGRINFGRSSSQIPDRASDDTVQCMILSEGFLPGRVCGISKPEAPGVHDLLREEIV